MNSRRPSKASPDFSRAIQELRIPTLHAAGARTQGGLPGAREMACGLPPNHAAKLAVVLGASNLLSSDKLTREVQRWSVDPPMVVLLF
jgi:hypothetical protein